MHIVALLHFISDFIECIINNYMALYINDNNILYYYMDAFWPIMLWYSCFPSDDYLFVQGWIRAMPLSPTYTVLMKPTFY